MTWRGEKSYYWDLNSDPSAIQPVASQYTKYAILAITTANTQPLSSLIVAREWLPIM
jgi:hypothetical protein